MRVLFNNQYRRNVYEIFASDCYATEDMSVILSTLLGSCISVCMKDPVAKVAGINHFMLPRKTNSSIVGFGNDTRYGVNAMEVMINEMMKKGALRKRLQAKVFGGGKVMEAVVSNVAQSNIDFAKEYLRKEGIPIIASDVGNSQGRKILFFPDTFDVYVRRIHQTKLTSTVKAEKRLIEKIDKQGHLQEGDFELFD